jgi:glutamine---fructose-6-phosphate transaminase (isomerizing)
MTAQRPTLGGETWDEISTQPESWERAHAQAVGELSGYPADGERVLIMGCGTSYYAAIAWAWIREQAGHGVTDAVIASEFTTLTRDYDRVIAISRSGTSVDVVEALERLDPSVRLTAVLGDLDTPIGARATDIIDLSYADETSVVQTRFPTTLLALVRARHGESAEAQTALIAAGRASVEAGADAQMPRQLVVLGAGYAAALAQEAALKCRESAGMWAEAYATGEYRHGPISVAASGTLVWGVTPIPAIVVEAIEATGASVRQPAGDPLAELVTLQFHAVAWASSVGRDANLPIHLSRSVMTI